MMQIMQLPAQAAQIEITEALADVDNLVVMLREAEEEYERGETKPMSKICPIAHD